MFLTFNQKAELIIGNSTDDVEIFKGGSTIDARITEEDSDTIDFRWEGLVFVGVPKLFFINFAEQD